MDTGSFIPFLIQVIISAIGGFCAGMGVNWYFNQDEKKKGMQMIVIGIGLIVLAGCVRYLILERM